MRWKAQAEALRQWRKNEAKISQERLAEKIGCTRHYISTLESGHHRPGLDFAARIAALGGPPTDSWAEVEEREPVPA